MLHKDEVLCDKIRYSRSVEDRIDMAYTLAVRRGENNASIVLRNAANAVGVLSDLQEKYAASGFRMQYYHSIDHEPDGSTVRTIHVTIVAEDDYYD